MSKPWICWRRYETIWRVQSVLCETMRDWRGVALGTLAFVTVTVSVALVSEVFVESVQQAVLTV